MSLAQMFERRGIADQIKARIVTPPPGIPVGSLPARGEVELGFQQFNEMLNIEGITLLGALPPAIQIVTTFSGGVCAGNTQAEAVRTMLTNIASPAATEAKHRHGMDPA